MLENKNSAVIYRGGWFIGGAVAQTFANVVTSGTLPSYIPPASVTTQHQRKAA
ncbi:MAG TPA: hypothetical protein VE288_11710 [Rubrobacteraceae bacterium]|nr:hypothetical protein [Rubrobacteraceae bacterium]